MKESHPASNPIPLEQCHVCPSVSPAAQINVRECRARVCCTMTRHQISRNESAIIMCDGVCMKYKEAAKNNAGIVLRSMQRTVLIQARFFPDIFSERELHDDFLRFQECKVRRNSGFPRYCPERVLREPSRNQWSVAATVRLQKRVYASYHYIHTRKHKMTLSVVCWQERSLVNKR